MSDLSFWDILFLKDEISTEQYMLIEFGIPLIVLGVLLIGGAIYTYGPDIVCKLRRIRK